VVLGDVPAGAVARARGDVVVVGRLAGAVRSDTPDAVIFALSLDPSTASVTIAGEQADLSGPTAKLTALVVSRDAAAKGAPAVRQLPSASTAVATTTTPTTPTTSSPSTAQALSLAKQLAPVALGLAVVAAPATALSALASVGGADGLAGSLVEAVLFGAIILQGAKLLSEGSELLLEVLDPGVVGGVLLPVLGATPDALIILSSGLNGTPSEAAQQLSVGVGTLAGSNALLLSPAWAAAVFSGRCDLDPKTGEAIDRRLTVPLFGGGGSDGGADSSGEKEPSPWTSTGVTVDPDVKRGALIMALSVLLYGSVQIPSAFFNDPSDPKLAAAGAAACFLAGAAYCAYSVLSPELQRRRIAEARKRRLRALAAETLASRWLRGGGGDAPTTSPTTSTPTTTTPTRSRGPLLDSQGKVRRAVADAMFDEFDSDGSGHIDAAELRALLLGLQLGGGASGDDTSADSPQTKEAIEFFWREMDVDGSSTVCRDEFAAALQVWVDEKLRTQAQAQAQAQAATSSGSSSDGLKPPRAARADAWRSLLDPRQGGANAALLARLPEDDLEQLRRDAEAYATEEAEDEEDDEQEGHGGSGGAGATTELSRSAIVAKSAAFLAGGLGLCAVFSDPLVEALSHLAEDLNVNPFFIAFALTPLASNASEVLSSLSFVGRKRRRNASLAFANLYGSATINNTLVLGILLTVISTRGIPWVYSSETAAIAFVSVSAAAVAATRTTLPLWTALPIAAVWPLTLAGVYYLDTVLGWT
jgi:Ca2+/Na+ antiporter